jgi:hypothetical protein
MDYGVNVETKALTANTDDNWDVHTDMVNYWREKTKFNIELSHNGSRGMYFTDQEISKEEYIGLITNLGESVCAVSIGDYQSTITVWAEETDKK